MSDRIKDIINNYDIWIVSCGGVGSNYICDLLFDNQINTHCRRTTGHGEICHLLSKIIPDKKCIYVYGDYENAIKSQERRELLKTNLDKIIDNFKGKIPVEDPFLYKYQLENFKNTENTYLLKYPYSKEDLINCFLYLDLHFDYNKIEIKKRTTDKDFESKYKDKIKYYLNFG